MYSTCLFCNRSLGENQVIEAFPVGRRLAFDPRKGRLWAVCGTCRRWNLSPLEERWEAVEECEILFHSLPTRVHSDEIGAAKHPEGLHLIRIGDPVPVEFAVCRYGESLGNRRRRNAYYVAAGVGVGTALAVVGTVAGFGTAGFAYQIPNIINGVRSWVNRPALRFPDGSVRRVHQSRVDFLNPGEVEGLGLRVRLKKDHHVIFQDDEARRVASKVFPVINQKGAKLKTVEEAVTLLGDVGGPEAFLQETWGKARPRPGSSIRWVMSLDRKGAMVGALDPLSRIAIEMALHQEQEQRAMEGELDELLAAWKSAEEIAQISDDLLVPSSVEEKLASLKEADTSEKEA
jgi:hypothetical protein